MTDIEGVQDIIQGTGGQAEYKRANGEISTVSINMAGMGMRKIRIANLPPEVAEDITGLAFPVRENPIRKAGNMGTNLPILCSQCHPTSGNDPHENIFLPI